MGEIENVGNVRVGVGEKSENVRVAVRIRPMNENEKSRGDSTCLNADSEDILVIAQKFECLNAGGPRKVTSSTVCWSRRRTRRSATNAATSQS